MKKNIVSTFGWGAYKQRKRELADFATSCAAPPLRRVMLTDREARARLLHRWDSVTETPWALVRGIVARSAKGTWNAEKEKHSKGRTPNGERRIRHGIPRTETPLVPHFVF